MATRRWRAGAAGACAALLCHLPAWRAWGADGFDLTLPRLAVAGGEGVAATAPPRVDTGGIAGYFAGWDARVARVRAAQPRWISPLVTTTGLLEQRVRVDAALQQAGNGTHTFAYDGGKGVDLILSDSMEIQVASIPYYIRSGAPGRGPASAIQPLSGAGDWPFLRIEQRLASAPAGAGDYVVTAWLQMQAPAGVARLTSGAWTWVPTLAAGKGWGDFDVQATLGAAIPASRADVIGYQVLTNVALQYRVMQVLWPELEVNWTWYANGQRGGLNQVYLTPGLMVGRFALNDRLKLSFGIGCQVAVAPAYRAKPLTPSYDRAWIFTTRMNF